VSASTLALAGAGIGVFEILRGVAAREETMIVLSSGIFAFSVLAASLVFRKIPVQRIATAATAFYTVYLCTGIVISLFCQVDHQNLFVYLIWFFPLLLFNRLVNSAAMGRSFARVILIAPVAILCCLCFKVIALFGAASVYRVVVFCLSYVFFGVMLNLITRYREAYIAERAHAESLRIESEVLESISDCFISLDSEFKLVYLNDAACCELGVERQAALNGAIPSVIPGFFSDAMLAGLRAASFKDSASVFEAQDDQQSRWYEMRCFPRPGRISIYFRNITETVLSRRNLEAAHSRLREQSELLDKAQDAIFVQDMDSCILYWNKGAERLFGWSAAEVLGKRVGEVFVQHTGEVRGAFNSVLEHGDWTCELSKCHKDGRTFIVESRNTLLRGDDGLPRSILSINTDITERKAADARIHNLAFYDILTGLPNRLLLRDKLEYSLTAAISPEYMSALLLIDLDDFKTLNDTAGHDIGDLLIKEVGMRLTSCVRKSDSVARSGGDEFVVMLDGLTPVPGIAAAEVRAVGEKILRACRQPYLLGNYEYDGTTSIGATLFQGDQDTADELLKRVDLAMYRAKSQGRNTLCFFDPGMETHAASRAALLADLKRAIQNREFELHYQPQLDSDGRVIGAEALLRWRHVQRGMVPPNEFIPLAEAAGLIVDLGNWVLETACNQLAAWSMQTEMAELSIAVNVSIRQFLDSRFVQTVEKVLRDSGADPRSLKLEITESFVMDKAAETIAKMTALKAHGVGFSMDDFGTGYSSLSQLKNLPLDQLKIDQSFVRDVLNGARDASIVRTIITLGRSLNLSVIAEGVETEDQRDFLEKHGCHAFQGFLFSPALPALKFESFVDEARRVKEEGAA
jgi:diguanylate cyclase (GGDEF)-like protein/PAS domain S-box-containing protein